MINKEDLKNTDSLNDAIIANECITSLIKLILDGPKYLVPLLESISTKLDKFFVTEPE